MPLAEAPLASGGMAPLIGALLVRCLLQAGWDLEHLDAACVQHCEACLCSGVREGMLTPKPVVCSVPHSRVLMLHSRTWCCDPNP